MKKIIVGIVASAAIISASVLFALVPLKLKEDSLTALLPFFSILFAVSLIMERSIEVFLSAFRSEEADKQDQQISVMNNNIKEKQALSMPHDDLKEELKKLMDARTVYSGKSRTIALWGGLFLGLAISAVGFRALNLFIEPQTVAALKDNNWPQYNLLCMLDITLTGSLLAGGSQTINQIMKVYSSVMEFAQEKTRQKQG